MLFNVISYIVQYYLMLFRIISILFNIILYYLILFNGKFMEFEWG